MSLIPQEGFKSGIQVLLLHQISLFKKAKNVDDEIWLHSQFSEIYQKYVELNKDKSDRQSFLNQLRPKVRERLLSYPNVGEKKEIVHALLKMMNAKNYPYIKQQIEIFSQWIGPIDTFKIID